jgi:hypothetical protein
LTSLGGEITVECIVLASGRAPQELRKLRGSLMRPLSHLSPHATTRDFREITSPGGFGGGSNPGGPPVVEEKICGRSISCLPGVLAAALHGEFMAPLPQLPSTLLEATDRWEVGSVP